MPHWSMRMRKKMEKRLLRALEQRRRYFESESVELDLWIREAFLRTNDDQGNRYTFTISTAFADAGFYISVNSIDLAVQYPEMHQIRDLEEVLAFIEHRIDQIHGKDQGEEVILPHIEAWAGSREEARRWYRDTTISALGGLTAQQLVARGRKGDVLHYIK